MKWIISILLVLCIIPIVSATDDDIITWESGEKVVINSLCSDLNGGLCNSSAICNVTIYNPDWSINYTQKPMTYKSPGFFYTNLTAYSQEGDYKGVVSCAYPNSLKGNSRADFRIVSIGNGTEFKMISIILLMAGLIGLFFYIGVKGKEHITNIDWLKEFLGFISVNIALLLIPVTLGMVGKIYQIAVLEYVYITTWYIVLIIILLNLIINLWSFIPLVWQKVSKIMENW